MMAVTFRIRLILTCLFTVLLLNTSTLNAGTGRPDTILVFHPTAETFETIAFLLKEDILDLNDYFFLGVHHSKEIYDYSLTQDLIPELPGNHFGLRTLNGDLDPENIYGPNSCSSEFTSLFRQSVAALFFGGPDIPPALYGEESHLLTDVQDPNRHYLELSYIYHVLGGFQNEQYQPLILSRPDYVISGICLGMQSIAVATGGTLIQDIPFQTYQLESCEALTALGEDQLHRNYLPRLDQSVNLATSYHFHHIYPVKNSFMSAIIPDSPPVVLSSHHQAVDKKGKGIMVAALSADGKIVEAIGHEHFKGVIGVQFHPEKTALYEPGVRYAVSADSSICFHDYINDQHSCGFHLEYWSYVGALIKRSSASSRGD